MSDELYSIVFKFIPKDFVLQQAPLVQIEKPSIIQPKKGSVAKAGLVSLRFSKIKIPKIKRIAIPTKGIMLPDSTKVLDRIKLNKSRTKTTEINKTITKEVPVEEKPIQKDTEKNNQIDMSYLQNNLDKKDAIIAELKKNVIEAAQNERKLVKFPKNVLSKPERIAAELQPGKINKDNNTLIKQLQNPTNQQNESVLNSLKSSDVQLPPHPKATTNFNDLLKGANANNDQKDIKNTAKSVDKVKFSDPPKQTTFSVGKVDVPGMPEKTVAKPSNAPRGEVPNKKQKSIEGIPDVSPINKKQEQKISNIEDLQEIGVKPTDAGAKYRTDKRNQVKGDD